MALTGLTNLQPLHIKTVGIGTFDNTVSIGGTLTYEDVTNVDAIGLITARSGINVSGGQLDVGSSIKLGNAGVITATSFSGSGANLTGITIPGGGTGLDLDDNARIRLGTGNDLQIWHNGSESYISEAGTGGLTMYADHLKLEDPSGEKMIYATSNGAVELYHNNVKALETKVNQGNSGSGVVINNPTGTGNRVLDVKHTSGDYCFISLNDQNTTDTGHVRIGALGNEMWIYAGGHHAIKIDTSGNFLPASNNSFDLGASGTRWRNVYTYDLNLSNKGSTNSVDNTWGDYTIQEGESDLFLINNRNGKKYKFMLQEVS